MSEKGVAMAPAGGKLKDDPMLMSLVKQPGVTCWRVEVR